MIPGHIFFLTITHFISTDSQDSFGFVIFYLTAAMIQVRFKIIKVFISNKYLPSHFSGWNAPLHGGHSDSMVMDAKY